MIKSIKDPHLDFSVAAARMASDMGLPIADCKEYAALITGDFAARLIAFSKAAGEVIKINHGNRPLSYQDHKANNPDNHYNWNPTKLPEGGGSILDQCKCWSHSKATLLAPPGQSPHMCGIAVDVAAGKLKSASNASLKAYGLCKPVSNEDWHVEPLLKNRPKGYARYELAVSLGLPFVWGKTKLGDKGVTVCQVQQALIRKGFALDGVDGIFGEKTDYMIIKFQKANFLSVNAIADAATLKALGLNKIEKGEEDMLIIIGSKGPAVVAWQRALISAGFPGKMDLAKIKEDSPFGDATAAATMEFQAACGLPQTGKVDDATAAAMWGRAGDADIALLRKHLSEAMDIGQKASAELTALKTEFSGYKNNVASKKLDAKAALNALAATIEKL